MSLLSYLFWWICLLKFIRESKNRIELRWNTFCKSNLFSLQINSLCVKRVKQLSLGKVVLRISMTQLVQKFLYHYYRGIPFLYPSHFSYCYDLITICFPFDVNFLRKEISILPIFVLLIYKVLAHKGSSKQKRDIEFQFMAHILFFWEIQSKSPS